MTRFAGSVVLITGASSGIGAALAREFARQGADVVLTARRVDRLTALAEEITRGGRRALALPCDVTVDGQIEGAVATACRRFGRLDVVVANAGFGVVGPVERLRLTDYRRQFETNVFGVLRTAQAGIEDLKRARGRLVIVGSVSGHISTPGSSPYSMSKFAVRALAEALGHELAPAGVSVTLVSPGFVESEIRRVDNEGVLRAEAPDTIPAWLRMPAAKAARQIVRAVARRRREVVITGHGKIVVWLQRHVPWLV
ncbi:MAG: SDR family NAD(P)-dependent oxidoreductase, partial [Candidatus Limnocylindria bacterium]